jgi:hypothetical protein
VPLAEDLYIRLINQPGRAHRSTMSLDFGRQRRAELLDPTQDCPTAHVDVTAGQDASDAFSRGAQLHVVPNSEQDHVTREAMT